MSLYLDKMKLSWGRRGGRTSGERTRSHANIWVPIKVYQNGLYWLGDSLKLLGVCCKGFVRASFFSCQRGIRRSTITIALSCSLLLFESSPPNQETRPGSYRCLETPDDLSPGLKEGTSSDQVVGHWFCDARSSCLLSRDARRINLAPRRVDMRSVQNQGEEREGGGKGQEISKVAIDSPGTDYNVPIYSLCLRCTRCILTYLLWMYLCWWKFYAHTHMD